MAAMLDQRAFTLAFEQLCHAFGEPVNSQRLWQYLKAFEELTEPQVEQLLKWAIDNVDAPFPRIAKLKQYAIAQGWYNKAPSSRDTFLHVVCSECGGSFAVRRSQLEQDASAGRTYRCINNTHWHCPALFPAQTLLSKEDP